ncbi:MAG: hypothetical protein ACI35W_01285 [Anaeroplasmataceae bacterium]
MSIEIIKSLACTALGIIITFITFILKVIKKNKIIKKSDGLISVLSILEAEIIEAEKNTNYTGEEKKNYVLTRINQYMIDHNLKFNKEYIEAKLEELIELTKEVNINTKKGDWLE